MDNVLKLVKLVSKYANCSRKFAANFLLQVFLNYHIFNLPETKQNIIFENLITFFDDIVICFDRAGKLENQKNYLFNKNDIFIHIESKIKNLVNIV